MTKLLLPIIVYAVLAGGFLFGCYFLSIGARNVWRGLASARWPKTPGVVTTSSTNSATSFDSKTGRKDVDYCANLAIKYTVNGRDYTTQLLSFGQTLGSGDPTEAQLRHLRYPEGATTSVSYNPADPSIAAVEPGFHASSLWLVMAGLMFALPCVMAGAIYSTSLSGGSDNVGMTIGIGIFAAIFAMLGIAALTFGSVNLWLAHASRNWPTTQGVITYQMVDASEVDTPVEQDPQQSDSSSKDTDRTQTVRSTTYTDYLVFIYTVDGKKRYSNVRRFGQVGGGSEADAEALKARYPAGSAVTVAYSPENPDLAVIEPGIGSDAYWMPGIGAAVLLFVLAICVWVLPSIARSP